MDLKIFVIRANKVIKKFIKLLEIFSKDIKNMYIILFCSQIATIKKNLVHLSFMQQLLLCGLGKRSILSC